MYYDDNPHKDSYTHSHTLTHTPIHPRNTIHSGKQKYVTKYVKFDESAGDDDVDGETVQRQRSLAANIPHDEEMPKRKHTMKKYLMSK